MPMTRPELDELTARGCGDPACTNHGNAACKTLRLSPRCHRGAAVSVSYRNGSGVLRLACGRCDKVIAMVAVADDATAAEGG